MLSGSHEISATEFKATCLKVMDEVQHNHIDVIITKHGKPIAMLVSVPEADISENHCNPEHSLTGSMSMAFYLK